MNYKDLFFKFNAHTILALFCLFSLFSESHSFAQGRTPPRNTTLFDVLFEAPKSNSKAGSVAPTPSDRGVWNSRCIQSFVKNGYNVQKSGIVYQCSQINNEFGLKAIQKSTEAKVLMNEEVIVALRNQDSALGVECVSKLVDAKVELINHRGINLVWLCQKMNNSNSLEALGSVLKKGKGVHVDAMDAIVKLKTPAGKECVRTIMSSYDVLQPDWAYMCSGLSYNSFGLGVLEAVVNQSKVTLTNDLVNASLFVKSELGQTCVLILKANGYLISKDSTLFVCSRFKSVNGLEALAAVAKSGIEIKIETLEAFSIIQ